MQQMVFPFVGGLGLFLIGMMLLSQGLVAFGGTAMKHALARFTGTPAKAFLSGTLATMAVQSSTATTVTLIGFVSAGLISFSQAIGVLIGASLGNTATGWIVATLGLKINLGFYTLPLIGVGAMLKLLVRGSWSQLGLAMAGFGMLFLGIDTLQDGMRGLSAVFDLASLPAGGFVALLLAMLIGLALTAVLQSSTAAIATTLTALHAQAINFEQAAALVVGAAIGTTLTGALVAIGSTVYAKRTALAYVLFNAVAGALAIILLPLFLRVINWLMQLGLDAGATSLAAFHTLFIAVGVVLFLPFVGPFSRGVERMLPEKGELATQHLDKSLLSIPSVALEASQRALKEVSLRLLRVYGDLLRGTDPEAHLPTLHQVEPLLNETYDFISRIETPAGDAGNVAKRIALLHAIDHLLRLRGRLHDFSEAPMDLADPTFQAGVEHSLRLVGMAREGLERSDGPVDVEQIGAVAATLSERSRQERYQLLRMAPVDHDGSPDALRHTDTFRSLDRMGNHIWRICHYLSEAGAQDAPPPTT